MSLDALAHWLRPAGGGLYAVSTGRQEQEALQKALYGVQHTPDIDRAWRAALASLSSARAAVVGIPSDTGAGLVRGSAYGPSELRKTWLRHADRSPAQWPGLVDAGDVRVVPQLLHDEMLNDAQLHATRAALYANEPNGATWPVSPLSIAEAAFDCMWTCNSKLKLLVLGGDHSVAWPVVAALAKHQGEPWGIVHFDAHTDLLETRLGVRYCFATWAHHAVRALGQGGRMVQLGIRASSRDRGHWESSHGVKQLWAHEINTRPAGATIDEVVAHLKAQGVRNLYISNDIDGTDAQAAPATGTPEPAGLAPDLVLGLIEALGKEFNVVAADLVEVAPPVGDPAGAARTCELGVAYLVASVAAML